MHPLSAMADISCGMKMIKMLLFIFNFVFSVSYLHLFTYTCLMHVLKWITDSNTTKSTLYFLWISITFHISFYCSTPGLFALKYKYVVVNLLWIISIYKYSNLLFPIYVSTRTYGKQLDLWESFWATLVTFAWRKILPCYPY